MTRDTGDAGDQGDQGDRSDQASAADPGETRAHGEPGTAARPGAAGDPARAASRQAAAGKGVDAALLREVVKMQPFTRWTGLEILKAENGEVETRLTLRKEDMTQHHGFLHGGLVGFLADNAAAYAAATMVGDVVTSQFSLNFLAPGLGEAFRARAHVVKAGKRQVTVRVDVIAEQAGADKLIAVAQATITPVG